VWEDRDAAALMLAAGIPAAWVREAPGVRVDDLPTRWGPISFAMTAPAADRVELVFGEPTAWPQGGVRVHSPLDGPVRWATADGRQATIDGDVVVLDDPAQRIVIAH